MMFDVPQGFIQGPLIIFFPLYMLILGTDIHKHCITFNYYADDMLTNVLLHYSDKAEVSLLIM